LAYNDPSLCVSTQELLDFLLRPWPQYFVGPDWLCVP
jgi:hypothetical protein